MESSNAADYTYIPPDNRMFGAIIAGALFEFAVFAALWLVFDSPKMAAALWLFIHIVILSMGIGAFMMHKSQSSTIAALSQRQIAPPEIIDAQVRQLPAPRADDWQSIDGNLMLRGEMIERIAVKVYTRMWPHTQPTQANIKAMFPDIQSNGTITAVMEYLVNKGVADGGGHGSAYHWVDRES